MFNKLKTQTNYGNISIRQEIVEKYYPIIIEAFSKIKFFPVKVEFYYHYLAFNMVGLSPDFEKIEPNEKTPDYRIIIYIKDQKFESVKIEKADWSETVIRNV